MEDVSVAGETYAPSWVTLVRGASRFAQRQERLYHDTMIQNVHSWRRVVVTLQIKWQADVVGVTRRRQSCKESMCQGEERQRVNDNIK